MNNYQYILEPLLELTLDKKRTRVKQCPCNKNNKDGKFIPFKDYDDRGYCHSCDLWFSVAANTCIKCKTEHAFSRYIDTHNSNTHLSNDTGKCLYCDYHYTPKQYFDANPTSKSVHVVHSASPANTPNNMSRLNRVNNMNIVNTMSKKKDCYIEAGIFKSSLKGYETNNFAQFLIGVFGCSTSKLLVEKYFIGTSKHWDGSTVFWQIDLNGIIKAGKIMLYNASAGKRVKEPYEHITWVHTALKLSDYELQQCFFGSHLLKDQTKPVAIVESEKTAVIASVYFPEFIWIAAGNKNGLSVEKCKVLRGRDVVLFPDLNACSEWETKAEELSDIANFKVSHLLETKATEEERCKGLDLADYLLKIPYSPSGTRNQTTEELCSEDLTYYPCDTVTGKETGKLSIITISSHGKTYDVLFDETEELVAYNERQKDVHKIQETFNKQFNLISIDGIMCWGHSIKK